MSKKPAAKKPAKSKKSPNADTPESQGSATPAATSPNADTGVLGNATPSEAQAQVAAAKAKLAEVEATPEVFEVPNLGDSEIISIPMSKIDLPPKNEQTRPFNADDPEFLRKVEFAKTNRKWLSNVIVTKGEGGRYVLRAGRHRFEASKLNDWKEIEARVYGDLDIGTAMSIGLMENIHAKTMTKTEIAASMAAIMRRDPKATIARFAAGMNVTKNTVRNILALNNLVPEAQRKVGTGEIALANAYQLATLPQDVQSADDGAWIKSAVETKTTKFVKAVQEFLADLKGDKTGEVRSTSKARAKAAPKVAKPLGQTELEEALLEARNGDPKIMGAINESYQDGLIDGLLIALGKNPLLPGTSLAGYQAKPASPRDNG